MIRFLFRPGKRACKILKSVVSLLMVVTAVLLVYPAEALAADLSESAAETEPNLKFLSSYIYFGSASAYTSAVSGAQGSLNQVYPNYFNVAADGSLEITSAASRAFVDEMHAKGIRVVPFLSNHWDRAAGIAALNRRTALADEVAAQVEAFGLDGIHIDLENLTPDERAAYVDFMRLLREKLPEEKEVSIAVAANPYGTDKDWQGSYDYAGLAQYCDPIVIMAYDEHYQTGPAGPVASLFFVDRSLKYAVSRVPASQVVLAVPFYGRIWKDGGGYPNGYGISDKKIDQLRMTYHGKAYYDNASQTSYMKFTVAAADPKPTVGGKSLPAGTYTVWYSGETAVKKSLELAVRYGIKGAASWSLGQESAITWTYFRLWLNGCTFGDIQNHWARDAVFDAFLRGWVNGESPSSFAPEKPLTRAQAAVMLVRALGLPVGGAPGRAAEFADTAGHWAEAEIAAARQYGIVEGVGGDRFDPDRTVTREQMAVMLHRLTACAPDGAAEPVFSDVTRDGNAWSYDAISAVSRVGLYRGYGDGSFRPGERLTRAQMAVLLGRLAAAEG